MVSGLGIALFVENPNTEMEPEMVSCRFNKEVDGNRSTNPD